MNLLLSQLIFISFSVLVTAKQLPYINVSSCTGTTNGRPQFFNPATMACDTCQEDITIQKRSSDGTSCQCMPGYKLLTNTGGTKIKCEPCPKATPVTSADGWSCVDCSNTTKDSTGTSCIACNSSQIAVERDVSGNRYNTLATGAGNNMRICVTCLSGTAPSSDGTQCVSCSQNGSCLCSGSQLGGLCVSANTMSAQISYSLSTTSEISPTQSVTSKYFTDYLPGAFDQCNVGNSTACQLLGNLCVLLFYTSSGTGDACDKYLALKSAKGGVSTDWPPDMPWLYYSYNTGGVADATLSDSTSTYSLVSGANMSLVAAKFALNGTFLGYVSVLNGVLQLCGDSLTNTNAAYRQGTSYKQTCTISVDKLFDTSQYPMVFYDLYLSVISSSGTVNLMDVPVLIYNYKYGSTTPNEQSSRTNWQLTRRFFLVNNLATIKAGSTVADFVQYASEMTLTVTLQPNQQNGYIYPPYLSIRYATILSSQLGQSRAAAARFSVTYTTDQTQFQNQLSVAMGVTCALAALWAIFRTWAWARRAGLIGGDIVLVIKFLLYAAGHISNMFLLVTFSICFYYLVFYKNQTTMAIFISNSDQESWVIVYIAVAAALKLIDVIHLIAVQCTVDIFFIDWERPKFEGMNAFYKQHLNSEAMVDDKDQITSSTAALTRGDNEAGLNRRGNKPTVGKKQVISSAYEPEDSVSIWRTYFCCNEWNEIQTHRKTWPLFTVFSVLFFMKIVGFENVVSYDPNGVVTLYPTGYRSSDTRVFRIGLIVAIFIISGAVQWAFNLLIYEKLIDDKLRNYVDLCSVCNVSVFVMATRQYGYYIHGQSVHSTSDVGLRMMYEQLQKEKDNLVPLRGLDKANDQQTFMMSLPTAVRENLDRLYAPFIDGKNVAIQLKTYRMLNRFLSQFIYQGDSETMHYTITQRNFIEDILDCEMADSSKEGRFYKDEGTSFGNVLFYGNELTLFTFEILVFCVFDIIWMNTVLDAIMLWVIMQIVTTVRDNLGLRNLTKKTLVDERFLI